jgi:hypothetical protein
MAQGQKLELTWLGKDTKIQVEPRILIEDTDKSNYTESLAQSNEVK